MSWEFTATIFGEAASKSNSSRIVSKGRYKRIIKSEKALEFLDIIRAQLPIQETLLTGDLETEIKLVYKSRRSDLDPSLVFDGLQGRVYVNDRQIKRMVVEWDLDPACPRVEVKVRRLPPGWKSTL